MQHQNMTSGAVQKSYAVESPVPSNLQVFKTGKKGQADPNTVAVATVTQRRSSASQTFADKNITVMEHFYKRVVSENPEGSGYTFCREKKLLRVLTWNAFRMGLMSEIFATTRTKANKFCIQSRPKVKCPMEPCCSNGEWDTALSWGTLFDEVSQSGTVSTSNRKNTVNSPEFYLPLWLQAVVFNENWLAQQNSKQKKTFVCFWFLSSLFRKTWRV